MTREKNYHSSLAIHQARRAALFHHMYFLARLCGRECLKQNQAYWLVRISVISTLISIAQWLPDVDPVHEHLPVDTLAHGLDRVLFKYLIAVISGFDIV
jgi:hypothetical protein